MTETEHAEISRRLALAIGHPPASIQAFNPPKDVGVVVRAGLGFRLFDYRDPAVIWAVAERFNCFPSQWSNEDDSWVAVGPDARYYKADTAAKAVALAVIKAKESK